MENNNENENIKSNLIFNNNNINNNYEINKDLIDNVFILI